ncbi:hypothetical protein Tco_1259468 [Tanacetum coccineum]
MQDETVIGLPTPTRNPGSLETARCLVHPAYIGLLRVKRSSNSTASFGSNPMMFQEMMQQQIEIEQKEKIKRMDREMNSRVVLNNSKRVSEDLKVLQMSMDGMDPIDAAIVNA